MRANPPWQERRYAYKIEEVMESRSFSQDVVSKENRLKVWTNNGVDETSRGTCRFIANHQRELLFFCDGVLQGSLRAGQECT